MDLVRDPAPLSHNSSHVVQETKLPMNDSNAKSQAIQSFQDIAFGSIAGIAGKYIEYPFDTLKVRLQSQPEGRPALYTGPLDCFRQAVKADGLLGLYRGVSAPLAGAAVETGSLFFSYRLAQNVLQVTVYADSPSDQQIPMIGLCVAGAMSGAFTSLLLTPIELVKCKMQVPAVSTAASDGAAPSILSVAASIMKHRGLLGFWNGQLGTLIRETGGSAAWFGSYEGVGLYFKNRKRAQGLPGDITILEQLLAGAAAGMSYNFTFYPADTIKSRMQTEDVTISRATGVKKPTFFSVGKALWKDQGLRGMYRGCGITMARSAPSSAVTFTIYEALKSHFG